MCAAYSAREACREWPDGCGHGRHAGAEAPGVPGARGGPRPTPLTACEEPHGSQVRATRTAALSTGRMLWHRVESLQLLCSYSSLK